jgi:hypothetical protein
MKWNVYIENINSNEIKVFNIFDHCSFREDVEKYFKKYKNKEEFAEHLKRSLTYYFWSKCEWEVVITGWIPHITMEELDRLNSEREKTLKEYNREPYRLYVNPELGIKIDVYNQVMNNWDIFLDYCWNSKIHRPRKKYSNWEYDPNGMDWGIGAWRCRECRTKNDDLGNTKDIDPYLFAGSKFCPHCGLPMKNI